VHKVDTDIQLARHTRLIEHLRYLIFVILNSSKIIYWLLATCSNYRPVYLNCYVILRYFILTFIFYILLFNIKFHIYFCYLFISSMMIKLKSSSLVLVMIDSISLMICNRFHGRLNNTVKITTFRRHRSLMPLCTGFFEPKSSKNKNVKIHVHINEINAPKPKPTK